MEQQAAAPPEPEPVREPSPAPPPPPSTSAQPADAADGAAAASESAQAGHEVPSNPCFSSVRNSDYNIKLLCCRNESTASKATCGSMSRLCFGPIAADPY